MKNPCLPLLVILFSSLLSLTANAASNRADYDLDDDGLIEINDWADLNEVRNNLTGTALYGSSAGCPAAGCNGFELTTDLNFDTNGDGNLDAGDTYWNDGKGWDPIGSSYYSNFTARFDGGNHVIRNLFINRPTETHVSLFGYVTKTTIGNLGVAGSLTRVTGGAYTSGLVAELIDSTLTASYFMGSVNGLAEKVGGLVGRMSYSTLKESYFMGSVTASGNDVGGLVGDGYGSITACFSTGSVTSSGQDVGGIVGVGGSSLYITATFSQAHVTGANAVGGLSGRDGVITASYSTGQVVITGNETYSYIGGLTGVFGTGVNNYWATDTSGTTISTSSYSPLGTGYTLAELQCPTSANNTSCVSGKTLYLDWGTFKDDKGNAYWHFGTSNQLPALVFNGVVMRDADGDGLFDFEDSDDDNDGISDSLDKFPTSAAASVDFDGDGRPDAWLVSCDTACQTASGLSLDKYLNDKDNDGVPDSQDTDNTKDNGKPTLSAVPADINTGAAGDTTLVTLNKANVGATDAVDSSLSLEASIDGKALTLDADSKVSLASGAWKVQWVAIDKAGNRSNALVQTVNIYPSVKFTQATSSVREGTSTKIGLSFSGASPVYPVILKLAVSTSLSSSLITPASAADIGSGIDLNNVTVTFNSAAELAKAVVAIPVVSDAIEESDETLSVKIVSATAGSSQPFALPFDGNYGHEFTIIAAAQGRADYDLDDNGLIEINSWADLNEIRNHPDGKGLYGSSAGCPAAGCKGFELTTDLNFDTNNNNQIDAGDIYWNDDKGFISIGDVEFLQGDVAFSGIFDGNYHSLNNMKITGEGLFFSVATTGVVRNLALVGPLTNVTGKFTTGALVGRLNGVIENCVASAKVESTFSFFNYAGGLVGFMQSGTISRSLSVGSLGVDSNTGGLVGYVSIESGNDARIKDVLSTARANAGLVVGSGDNLFISNAYAIGASGDKIGQSGLGGGAYTNSFWATDATGQSGNRGTGATPALLAQLKCPTAADNKTCLSGSTLYAGWGSQLNSQGKPVWDFGNGLQLPGLVFNGIVYRDSDGDGTLDQYDTDIDGDGVDNSADKLPSNAGASVDTDGDGYPDAWNAACDSGCQANSGLKLDVFPNSAAAFADTDGDGAPDSWSLGCNTACQTSSGLKLDAFPASAAVSVDSDGDGAPDAWNASCDAMCKTIAQAALISLDKFPLSAAASTDTDGDGSPDAWNSSCNATCQASSGLKLDAFPTKAAASLDTDGDGNPDAWNTSCDTSCQANSGLKLDALPKSAAASVDTDGDGSPDSWSPSCNAACQASSGLVLDAFPNNAAASVDSDADGSPEAWNSSCNTTCQANSGLKLDAFPTRAAVSIDTDGDGSPDSWSPSCNAVCQASSGLVLDAFPTNAAASVDSDADGSPDAWNPSCNASCQANSGLKLDAFPTNVAVSVDTDGDGIPDSWNLACNNTCKSSSGLVLDAFPTNAAASVDGDGDGSPDAWNASCDATCQANSGLKLDAFPTRIAASIDGDGDGRPDAWAASCDSSCKIASGLTLDKLIGDKDNDGIADANDPDNTRDNGKPTVIAVPETLSLAATGATTSVPLVKADVVAIDAVDDQLALEVSLAGKVLTLDSSNQVSLPSGALQLQWVAIDKAGNRSAPMAQLVNIYPQAQFTLQASTAGEKATAKLGISFSGPVPAYPVTVTFNWVSGDSTAVTADVNTSLETGVDLSKLTTKINSAEELASAALAIPIAADAISESDETLVFEVVSAVSGSDKPFTMPVNADKKRTTLTITELNLAPTVSLNMTQAGKATTVIDTKAGAVTVTAAVTDLNGKDQHSYLWGTTGLPVTGLNQKTYAFDPLTLTAGSYSLSVKVTDDGLPPLSSEEVKLNFTVAAEVSSSSSSSKSSSSAPKSSSSASNSSQSSSSSSAPGTGETPAQSGGGGGGGGSSDLWMLLLLSGLGLGAFGSRKKVALH